MTKVKEPRRKATALDRIAAQVRTALQSQTKNVIKIGKLLIESREHLEHGEWLPWLAENFDLSPRTAQRYIAATEYVARKGKSDTVAHFANLSPTVLYRLAEGQFDERVEAAILAEARKRRVDEDAMWAICEALAPPDDAADDDDQDDSGDDDGDDDAAENDPVIAAILDNPPTPPAGSSENLAPTDFALREFDQAIGVLKRLMTKSAAQFDDTIHGRDDLRNVASFIWAVMGKAKTNAVAANGSTEPPQ